MDGDGVVSSIKELVPDEVVHVDHVIGSGGVSICCTCNPSWFCPRHHRSSCALHVGATLVSPYGVTERPVVPTLILGEFPRYKVHANMLCCLVQLSMLLRL